MSGYKLMTVVRTHAAVIFFLIFASALLFALSSVARATCDIEYHSGFTPPTYQNHSNNSDDYTPPGGHPFVCYVRTDCASSRPVGILEMVYEQTGPDIFEDFGYGDGPVLSVRAGHVATPYHFPLGAELNLCPQPLLF